MICFEIRALGFQEVRKLYSTIVIIEIEDTQTKIGCYNFVCLRFYTALKCVVVKNFVPINYINQGLLYGVNHKMEFTTY